MKKITLTPKQVKQYELMSGLKTMGHVELQIQNDKVWDIYAFAILGGKK